MEPPTERTPDRRDGLRLLRALLPLLLLLLAFGLRLVRLDAFNLWGDEGWTLYLNALDLATLTVETGHDIHPPLYHYMGHLWARVAGSGVLASRFFSVFPGTLLVPLAVALGRRLGGPRTGWTGAALLALAPFAVHYSQEVRAFAWATLWCACALYLLLRALETGGWRAGVGYGALSLLAAYTSYSTAFWFAAHGALILLRRDWRRRFLSWFLVEAVVLLLALPWVLVYGRATGIHLAGQGAFTGRQSFTVLGLSARSLVGLVAGVTLPQRTAELLAAGAGVVAAVGVALGAFPRAGRPEAPERHPLSPADVSVRRHPMSVKETDGSPGIGGDCRGAKNGRHAMTGADGVTADSVPASQEGWVTREGRNGAAPLTTIWAWGTLALLPVLALYPVHLVYPWFEPRVVAFCVVPACLFLGACLGGWRTRGRWAFAIACALTVLALAPGLYDYAVRYQRYDPETEDYLPLIEALAGAASAGDVVLYNAPWHVGYFQANYRGPALDYAPLSREEVARAIGRPRQVWLVLRDIVRQPGGGRAEDRAEDDLSAVAFKVGETWYGQIRLARYVVAPGAAGEGRVDLSLAPPKAAAPSLWLRSAALVTDDHPGVAFVPGEAVYLTLTWEAAQPLDRSYHVFAQLIGPYNAARGSPVWAQHDGVPGNQERPTTGWVVGEAIVDRHVMWIDPDAPEAAYALQVGVYDPLTGERLRVRGVDGGEADAVILASLRLAGP